MSTFVDQLAQQLIGDVDNVVVSEMHAPFGDQSRSFSPQVFQQIEQAIITAAELGSTGHLISLELNNNHLGFNFANAVYGHATKEAFMNEVESRFYAAAVQDPDVTIQDAEYLIPVYEAAYDLWQTAQTYGSNVIFHDSFWDVGDPDSPEWGAIRTDDTDEFNHIQSTAEAIAQNTGMHGSIILHQGLAHINNAHGPNGYDDLARQAGQSVTTMFYMSPELAQLNWDFLEEFKESYGQQDPDMYTVVIDQIRDLLNGNQTPDISVIGDVIIDEPIGDHLIGPEQSETELNPETEIEPISFTEESTDPELILSAEDMLASIPHRITPGMPPELESLIQMKILVTASRNPETAMEMFKEVYNELAEHGGLEIVQDYLDENDDLNNNYLGFDGPDGPGEGEGPSGDGPSGGGPSGSGPSGSGPSGGGCSPDSSGPCF